MTLGAGLGTVPNERRFHVNMIEKALLGCGIAEGAAIYDGESVVQVPETCNPGSPPLDQWPAIVAAEVLAFRPSVVALLAGRWEVFDRTDSAGHMTNILHRAYATYIKRELDLYVRIASSHGAKVELITAPYFDSGDLPTGQPPPQDQPKRVDAYNRILDQVALDHPGVVGVVDLNAMVSPNGTYSSHVGRVLVRTPDGIHFPFYNFGVAPTGQSVSLGAINSFSTWIGQRMWPVVLQRYHQLTKTMRI